MKKAIIIGLTLAMLLGCKSNAPEQVTEKPSENEIYACGPGDSCVERTSTSDVLDKNMEIITWDESIKYLDSTVALFFSFENCPWCYDAIQVLNDIYSNHSIKTYYVKVERDERVDENETYQKLLDKFSAVVGEKMYMPFFVVLKDGEIVGSNTGTIEDHQKVEGVLPEISVEQKALLANIYDSLYAEAEK